MKTREARELLERWAGERKTGASEARPTSSDRAGDLHGGIDLESESPAASEVVEPTYRRHASHPPSGPVAIGQSGSRAAAGARGLAATHSAPRRGPQADASRLDGLHALPATSPHFEIQDSLLAEATRKTNWSSLLGHFLAYLGVALLTVGSSLVLWSHFGGPASYAPTGWLTTTAGQMLLFLGVVTLVSGGMEQAGDEVRARLERIGERIIRIEQLARDHSVHGPEIPAAHFADSDALAESPGAAAQRTIAAR